MSGDGEPSTTQTPNGTDRRDTVEVEGLHMAIMDARKTKGGKLTANIAITKDGKRIDVVTMTSVLSSRHMAAKAIAQHGHKADKLKIDAALGQLMTVASDLASQERVREGETMQAVTARIIAEDLHPAFRTAGGFYSESRGHEFRRQELLAYLPSHLVDAAALAVDAPQFDGEVCRTALIKSVEGELKVCFANLMRSLPIATDADLAANSSAGREFRNALVHLLTVAKTWEASAGGQAKRASLISRAASAARASVGNFKKWCRILDATNAWMRPYAGDDGEVTYLIAIRYELANQIGVTLPGVTDQDSLFTLGVRYGLIDPAPPVPAKAHHGEVRLAILRHEFTGPLLAAAGDFKDNDADPEEQNADTRHTKDSGAITPARKLLNFFVGR